MKRAILVISFGSSYLEALEKSICSIENKIKEEYSDFDVYRSFTSHFIIRKLKENHGIEIKMPEEALLNLYEEKYEEVIIQPLHIIAGEEFNYIKKVSDAYSDKFKSIKLGRPIFYYQGVEGLPQDYSLFIEGMSEVFNKNEGTVLVGHGTAHPANAAYGALQSVLEDEGYDNVFIGTIEGYPTFGNVINRVKKKNIKEVTLMPLLLVAGDHVKNDIASDEEYSWKSMFEREGIKVKVIMMGLGEFDKFNQLYINRINDLIENRYEGVGETKKGHKKRGHK
ncbi:sirohydrochlorin cobaltochelatase [Clostridium sp. LP20]|uniref:sirohydrochlorin cobaltochelatase n=1 Tax=Clostridium sp. LP20 TaxID=3418665 RepID=UPI003EE7E148